MIVIKMIEETFTRKDKNADWSIEDYKEFSNIGLKEYTGLTCDELLSQSIAWGGSESVERDTVLGKSRVTKRISISPAKEKKIIRTFGFRVR